MLKAATSAAELLAEEGVDAAVGSEIAEAA